MKQVKECGAYCQECQLFIKNDEIFEWECHCHGSTWSDAKIVLETGDKFFKEMKN